MDEVRKRRMLVQLGQRAVDYYVDTGLCVFCDADDCKGIPHDKDCEVGEVSGVVVNKERIAAKARERQAFHEALTRGITR